MRIFITGGTGFVGQNLVRQLVAAGHTLVALARPGSENKLPDVPQVEIHPGDVNDTDCLANGISGCDAIIHLVGIIREFPSKNITFDRLHVKATRNMINAATLAGGRRYLHMSANGVRPDAETAYHQTKWQAEQLVRASALDWTIFRPSLIFGPGGEFVEMLAELIRKLPVVPVIGDGQYRLQPVAVDQVAESFLKALSLETSIRRDYTLCGAASYSYDQILDLTGAALGRRKVAKLHQPLALVKPMIHLLEGFSKFPITNDQLIMLLEGNQCDPKPWADCFGIEPSSYADGIAACFS